MSFIVEPKDKEKLRELMKEHLDRGDKVYGPFDSVSEALKIYRSEILSIYGLNIPMQTTLLAIDELGGETLIENILKKTGMARSSEAKNLSLLRMYGYVEEKKSIGEPRKKVYYLTKFAQEEIQKLPEEFKNEIKRKRMKG